MSFNRVQRHAGIDYGLWWRYDSRQMGYDSKYIHDFLTREGDSVEDYFIVDGVVMTIGEMAGKKMPMAFLIEDDALDRACVEYLKGKGVRYFTSIDEVDF